MKIIQGRPKRSKLETSVKDLHIEKMKKGNTEVK